MSRASSAQDTYALGALFRHILTKTLPLDEVARPVRELRAEIPMDIERLVADLMHEQPEQRRGAAETTLRVEAALASIRS